MTKRIGKAPAICSSCRKQDESRRRTFIAAGWVRLFDVAALTLHLMLVCFFNGIQATLYFGSLL